MEKKYHPKMRLRLKLELVVSIKYICWHSIYSLFQIEEVRVSCDEIHDKVEFMKQIQSEILSSTTNDPSEI